MAYNNYFPQYYPQFQPINSPQNQPQMQAQNTNIIWVSGEAGAKSYLVAPNTTVQLWDSEAQVIYLKSADASGMPSMKIIDYTIRDTAPRTPMPAPAVEEYVTKSEFANLKEQVARLLASGKENTHESTVSTDE